MALARTGTATRVAAVIGVALVARGAVAQSATVQMSADRTEVVVGEKFTLTIQIDAQGDQTGAEELPDLSAFRIVGRRVSRPMQISLGWGTSQRSIRSSSVHELTLVAVNAGTFRITAPRVRVGGRTFTGEPLTIRVAPGTDLSGRPLPPPGGASPSSANPTDTVPSAIPSTVPRDALDDQAFVRLVVDKERVVVGEQVTATAYLYVRMLLQAAPVTTREPSTDGFWVQDLLPPSRSLEGTDVLVDGVPYRVYVLRRFAAFPLEAGTLTLGAMQIELDDGSLLRRLTGGAPLRRSSAPVTVVAEPLPREGKPAGSAPIAVGAYTLDASLDAADVTVGSAALLTATVSGTGNLRAVTLALPPIPGVRVHPPEIRDALGSPNDLVGGRRTFRWMLVPEAAGTHAVPPLELPMYRPAERRYDVARTAALVLRAAPGHAAAAGGTTRESPARNAARPDDGLELPPPRTRAALARTRESALDAPWFPWTFAAPPLAYAVFLASRGLRRLRRRHHEATASARAVRTARKRLHEAARLVEQADPRGFYAEATAVLRSVLDARLGTPTGGMTHGELAETLERRGLAPEIARRIVEELEHADFARFSSAALSTEEVRRSLDRLTSLVEALERFVPRGGEP